MTRELVPNGRIRVAIRKRWYGIAVRLGFDPNEETQHESPARITKKLARTSLFRFDRATGSELGRRSIHVKPRRLVAYQIGSGPWVEVPARVTGDDAHA